MTRHLRRAPRPIDLGAARAHWVTRELLALPATALPRQTPVGRLRWRLAYAAEGGLGPHLQESPGFDLVQDEAGLPVDVLHRAPHLAIIPGAAIALAVLGFNLFGDGLRDYLDPKLEGR